MDILEEIKKELPDVVESASFEGANIVLYTKDKEFFLEGEQQIRKIVDKIKKRVELRASQKLLLEKEKTEEFVKAIVPKDAEITEINFDVQRSVVVIEAKRPGIAIGKEGSILQAIKKESFWSAQVERSPAIRSMITEKIKNVLYVNDSYRRKFLDSIGKRIYKEWNPEKKDEWVRIGFLGGGRQVGRSCLFLQTEESKVLLDCGINIASEKEKFPFLNVPEFNLKELDAVIISHAHLDHVGLLPYLYKMGYRGPCYMTAPTRDISSLLALDYIGVSYKKAAMPLFSSEDIKEIVRHCICLNYNEVSDITPDLRLTFYNAGHAAGSAMVHLNIGNGLHNLLYTADMKYGVTRLLESAPTIFPRLETVIIESTYGAKEDILPSRKECEQQVMDIVKKTIERKGKILFPVLGVGRSQEVMLIVNEMIKQGMLEKIPVYIDGMVWDINAIHTAYPEFLSSQIRNEIFRDENPFTSEAFFRIGSAKERQEVIEGGPCVIVATSGMLVGGASLEYFRELAGNKNNSIVFTCYQGANSLGRQVKEGLKETVVDGKDGQEKVSINMEVVSMDGLSGHSGRNQLVAFINNLKPRPKRIIINHGEQSKCLDLASTLYKLYRTETIAPKNLEITRLR